MSNLAITVKNKSEKEQEIALLDTFENSKIPKDISIDAKPAPSYEFLKNSLRQNPFSIIDGDVKIDGEKDPTFQVVFKRKKSSGPQESVTWNPFANTTIPFNQPFDGGSEIHFTIPGKTEIKLYFQVQYL